MLNVLLKESQRTECYVMSTHDMETILYDTERGENQRIEYYMIHMN